MMPIETPEPEQLNAYMLLSYTNNLFFRHPP